MCGSPANIAYTAPPAGVSSPSSNFCDLLSFSATSTSSDGLSRPNAFRSAALSSTNRSEFNDESDDAMLDTALWSARYGLGATICQSPELLLLSDTGPASFFFRSIFVIEPSSSFRMAGGVSAEIFDASSFGG